MGIFVQEIVHVIAGDTTAVIDCNEGGDTSLVRYCVAAFVTPVNGTAGTQVGTLTTLTGTVSDGTCTLDSGALTVNVPYAVVSTTTLSNDTVTLNNTIDGGEYFVLLIGRP